MRVFRLLGVVFLAAGLGLIAWDAFAGGGDGFRLRALGEIWFMLHADSLQLLQPAVERHISPDLYYPYIQTLLEWPAAVEALVLGAVFTLLGQPWRRLG